MRTLSITGYPGYLATDTGEILGKAGAPLVGWWDDGYRHVSLHIAGRRTPKRVAVHKLIATTFHGPPAPGQEVRHLDDDRGNNVPGNLKWGTRKENASDMVEHGRSLFGDRNPNAKIGPTTVATIRHLRQRGRSQQWIADRLGIGQSQVSRILRGANWRHV